MELKLRKLQDVYIIDVIGELDLYNTTKLKDLFNKMVEKNVTSMIVNLDGVHYLDSSGVGTLINMYSVVQQKNIRFCLANLHSTAKKVIEQTRLAGYFPVEETIDDAMMRISG
jgi:anti-sigma B factor antagonist